MERGLKVGGDVSLSLEQKDILDLLTKEYLTPRQIALKRSTSKTAVYKTIEKLKKKGLFSRGLKKTVSTPSKIQPALPMEHSIRLHGQEFSIVIIQGSQFYENLRKRKNTILIDGNTVRLYKTSIEVYCAQARSFIGEDVQRATSLSFQYWSKFFHQLEDFTRVMFIKGMNTSIKQVNAHYAEINNEMAKDYNEKQVKLKIYGIDDGKVWFLIDNSWNLNEAETVHPQRSKHDMERLKDFFNDLREKDVPNMSGVMVIIDKLVSSHAMYAENITSHIWAIKTLSESVKELKETIKGMK